VSLSEDPTFSLLQKYFVCGYKDITNEPYSGVSMRHEVGSPSVDTTNGAGPHNLQIFFLAGDGTVINALTGFWHSDDLAKEMNLAARLHQIYTNPALSKAQKEDLFRQYHLAARTIHHGDRMQGFDMQYEAKNRAASTDTIKDAYRATIMAGSFSPMAFKSTGEIMHERIARQPFQRYSDFDVASFSDYGKPIYDKHENQMDGSGRMASRQEPVESQYLGNEQSLVKAAATDHQLARKLGMALATQIQPVQIRPNGWGNGGDPRYQTRSNLWGVNTTMQANGYGASGAWGTGKAWGNNGR
jgi:hypothetical protein